MIICHYNEVHNQVMHYNINSMKDIELYMIYQCSNLLIEHAGPRPIKSTPQLRAMPKKLYIAVRINFS